MFSYKKLVDMLVISNVKSIHQELRIKGLLLKHFPNIWIWKFSSKFKMLAMLRRYEIGCNWLLSCGCGEKILLTTLVSAWSTSYEEHINKHVFSNICWLPEILRETRLYISIQAKNKTHSSILTVHKGMQTETIEQHLAPHFQHQDFLSITVH